MKILDRLITLFVLIVLMIVLLMLVANWDNLPAAGAAVGAATQQAFEAAIKCLTAVVAAAGATLLFFGAYWAWGRWAEHRRQRDGSHSLRTYTVRETVTGERVRILVNPDLMLTPALAISSRGVHELGSLAPDVYAAHAAERARVSAVQALAPGDRAIADRYGSGYRPAGVMHGAGKLLTNGAQPRSNNNQAPAATPAPTMPAEPMTLHGALQASSPDKFVLGHNDEHRTLAAWSPRDHLNLGVFGVSGTGKTKSTGYQVMLLAARHGYHVVCLDPKGGVDFGAFAPYVEWHATDAYVLGDQLAALAQVHEARHLLMRDRQIGEWHALGTAAGPEIVVVLEEFGTMRTDIAARKGGGRELARVDSTLERMLRVARMTGFHFVILDQAPEKLDPVVRGACKMRLAYQLDTAQATLLKEYEADALPPNGAFLNRRKQYDAWLVAAELPRLLPSVPPMRYDRLLPAPNAQTNGPEPASPEVANARTAPNAPNGEGQTSQIPPLPMPPFDVREAPKRDLIFWWRDQYPTGTQAEFRTWIADHGRTIARGYISDTFAQWAETQAGKVGTADAETMTLEQLRAQGLAITFQGAHGSQYGWDDK